MIENGDEWEKKTDIQKIRLGWFGHLKWMKEERIPKKMIHKQIEGELPDGKIKLENIL